MVERERGAVCAKVVPKSPSLLSFWPTGYDAVFLHEPFMRGQGPFPTTSAWSTLLC